MRYEEYWQGFRALFGQTDVIAIGEPLVRAMAGLPPRVGGCGVSTVRVTPRATQPCVYWPGAGEPLSLLLSLRSGVGQTPPFVEARTTPDACRSCVYPESCYGGCPGRRRIQNALDQPDFYCPIVRGEVQKAGDSHGARTRASRARKRMYHRRDCARLRMAGLFRAGV